MTNAEKKLAKALEIREEYEERLRRSKSRIDTKTAVGIGIAVGVALSAAVLMVVK